MTNDLQTKKSYEQVEY